MKTRYKHIAPSLFLLALTGIASHPLQAAPITFNTALPVAEEEFVVRLQFKAGKTRQENQFPSRQVKVKAAVGVLGYGLSPDFTLFAVLPYVSKKLKTSGSNRESAGLSDLSIFARYTVYKNNMPGKTFRVAPFAGVNLATGKDTEKDRTGQIPPGLQPGSGSTDFFGGVVITYQTLAWQLDTQLRLDTFNEGNELERGNKISIAASMQYRIWPRDLGSDIPGFLYLVLESELSHQQKDKVAGTYNDDSGGNRWTISPGIQYVTWRWVAELSVQLPLKENLNGNTLETRYGINGGFRWNF